MTVKIFPLSVLTMLTLATQAQFIDSLPGVIRGKRNLDARLESRYSFVNHEAISVNGVRLGLAWQRKLRTGIGISWLDTPVEVQVPVRSESLQFRNFKFAYFCFYVDVVFHRTRRWQLSVPLQVGSGAAWFQRDAGYSFRTREPRYLLLLYEPGVTAQFKLVKWFGLGGDVAYRFAWNGISGIRGILNSPTYSFKILFWPDLLFFDLFPESKITKRYGPSYW